MHLTALEQLVAQHTADLRADAVHHRLVHRSRKAVGTTCTPRMERPSTHPVDVLADRRSASDDTPEPVERPPRPRGTDWRAKLPVPGTLVRKASAVFVCALLFVVLAAAATVERHRTGHVPTPASSSSPAGVAGGGSRVLVR
jgi:hypothetical protein